MKVSETSNIPRNRFKRNLASNDMLCLNRKRILFYNTNQCFRRDLNKACISRIMVSLKRLPQADKTDRNTQPCKNILVVKTRIKMQLALGERQP